MSETERVIRRLPLIIREQGPFVTAHPSEVLRLALSPGLYVGGRHPLKWWSAELFSLTRT